MTYKLSVTVAEFKNNKAKILGYPGNEVTLVSQKDSIMLVQNRAGDKFHVYSTAIEPI